MTERLLTEQVSDNAVDDIVDVVATSLEVGVIHFVEDRDQRIPLYLNRPLGIA